MTKEHISGEIDKVTGKLKQKVGEAIGNQALANEGVADQVKGNAKQVYGNIKEAVQRATEPALREHQSKVEANVSEFRDKVVAGAEHVTHAVQAEIDKRDAEHPSR